MQYLVSFANQHGMLWVDLDTASGYDEHGLYRLGASWALLRNRMMVKFTPVTWQRLIILGLE